MCSNNESLSDSHNVSLNTSQCGKDSRRNSKFSFKPFRLRDITQEILDAEDEPLTAIPLAYIESEESNDDNFGTNKNIIKSVVNESNEFVRVIETPIKANVKASQSSNSNTHVQNENNIFSSTPRVPNCAKDFLTPGFKSVPHKSSDVKKTLKPPLSTPKHINIKFKNFPIDDRMPAKLLQLNTNSNILLNTNKENTHVTNLIDIKEICVNNENYLILNQLGKGGSSVVYHCYNINTKVQRAIKKVNLESDVNRIGYINEVNVLSQLQNSDRIIRMHDFEYIEEEKTLLVVLEIGESDLSRILKDLTKSKKHLPLHIIIFYWMEMLYAVQQIHNNGIIHSDLKPANFLLVKGRLKLIDFGIATCVQDDMTSAFRTCQVGSFQYISPEALINQPSYNTGSPSFGKPKYKLKYKTDVWSLGCIFYQLVYQKTPFQHIDHMWAKLSVIMDPHHRINYPTLDWVPEKIVNTIKSCLQYNTEARPSIAELIQDYENVYFTKELQCGN